MQTAKDLFHGEKNGKGIGKRQDFVVKDAKERGNVKSR